MHARQPNKHPASNQTAHNSYSDSKTATDTLSHHRQPSMKNTQGDVTKRSGKKSSEPARTRTWNLSIRSRTPYPLGHRFAPSFGGGKKGYVKEFNHVKKRQIIIV
jgi:hypothetical protein